MSGPLSHSPSRIIEEYFILEAFGIDPNDWPGSGDIPNGQWPIYAGRMPDRPDDAINVNDTVGRDFGYTQMDSERQEMYGIQVMIRALDQDVGWRKSQNLAMALDRITRYPVVLSSAETGSGTGPGSMGVNYLIHSVFRTTQVIDLGRDTPQGKRQLFTINAIATIRQCF